MPDPESSSRSLNPDMVYRPISPPSNQLDAQDEHQQPIKLRFNLVAILRFFIVVFALAATCKVLTDRWLTSTVIVVVILEYICLGWNIIQLISLWLPKGKGGFYWRLRLGKLNCACGSEDEDPSERTALLDDGSDDKKDTLKLGANYVDLTLALLLVIFIPVDASYFYARAAFTGLSFTIFALELIVGILSVFRVFNGVRVEVYPDQSSAERFQYQIRLPVPEAKRPHGQHVSVASEDV